MTRWVTPGLIVGLAWMMLAPSVKALTQEKPAAEEVTLIRGLDGGSYEPYSSDLIETVQQALKTLGVYQGEVNGNLDEETMQAIGDFQKSHGLTVSGVPSPHTRKALLEQ
jgi:peptidoglycan hydrolase-like protein with peptidoglycan-binding domain